MLSATCFVKTPLNSQNLFAFDHTFALVRRTAERVIWHRATVEIHYSDTMATNNQNFKLLILNTINFDMCRGIVSAYVTEESANTVVS